MTIGPKLVGHPAMPLAMFAAGDVQLCYALATEIFRAANFCETGDELVDQLQDSVLRKYLRLGTPAGQHASFHMAFHGPTEGFQLRTFDTSAVSGREPFKLSSNLEYTMFGPVTDEGFRSHGLNPEMLPLSDGLERRGLQYMELYRRTPGRLPGEPEGTAGRYHSVGAQLQLCTVTSEAATIRAVGYWPDLIGEPIDPAADFYRAKPKRAPAVGHRPMAVRSI